MRSIVQYLNHLRLQRGPHVQRLLDGADALLGGRQLRTPQEAKPVLELLPECVRWPVFGPGSELVRDAPGKRLALEQLDFVLEKILRRRVRERKRNRSDIPQKLVAIETLDLQ